MKQINDRNNRNAVSINDINEFTLNRFSNIKATNKISELVHFHTINKYLLMSQDPNQLRDLGNTVANHEKLAINEVFGKYQATLNEIMVKTPTIKSHLNTIQHIFGHFSKNLNHEEKELFLSTMTEFKNEKITLSEILINLKKWTEQFDKTYLTRQTYFLLYANNGTVM